jgi:hypothetical protein
MNPHLEPLAAERTDPVQMVLRAEALLEAGELLAGIGAYQAVAARFPAFAEHCRQQIRTVAELYVHAL